MVLTAEITVSTDTFALGSLFDAFPNAVVEFEPVIPLQSNGETNSPLVWVNGVEPERVLPVLRETDDVEAVQRLATVDEDVLLKLEWGDDLDGIVQPLLDTGGRILTARGTANHWKFTLLFDSHVSLSEFNMIVTNNGIPVTLRKLSSSTVQRESGDGEPERSIPPNHRETLLLAYQNGYYDTPRECQLADLASKEEVSDSALSKRLRRATASLIERTLLDEEGLGNPPHE
ncbi:helix-turn-helix domain-containing protein [Natronolimnohabitans sp. A-GB9]|uniref:helix-turn-helix domain-containing protein n=1 Tax=Natronolimnohabitans sp. A-GB9 TaxID=3069757 RepID=UPI0027B6FAC9|nr:helix-turn-helix domain-containing protein [Natronolimnohabitans sp. A-GB9]MDQ2050152.1 helix-turn-helix domain-containing protein [Natronolimnohabitans sp. A-GB9]